MRVVAFLQNQWFRQPDRVKAIYDARPHLREELNKRFLFYNSLTGKRIKSAFGDLCNIVVWEEVSRQVADKSSGCFPPDLEHIAQVVEKHKPDCLLVFGKIALEGVTACPRASGIAKIVCPHPASRQKDVLDKLKAGAAELRRLLGPTQRT